MGLRYIILFRICLLLGLLLGSSIHVSGRKYVVIWDEEDKEGTGNRDELTLLKQDPDEGATASADGDEDSAELDELGDSDGVNFDPGSWRQMLEEEQEASDGIGDEEYASGLRAIVKAASQGHWGSLKDGIASLEAAADLGNAHAQSTMAFLFRYGYGVNQSDTKAIVYHHFAAEGGNFQSKMALAYSYFRLNMHELSVKLYAELAAIAVASFVRSRDSPLVEAVRLNEGFEESKHALKKFRGEEDDDFQFLEYQAHKGHAYAMYRLGVFYYMGLRGVRRDHSKALSWFLKAIGKGDVVSMEILAEMHANGYGVAKNFTEALKWFKAAARKGRFSAYNGIGYLYFRGHGVEEKNFTKAKEFFKKAAEHGEPDGHYNLGIMFFRGTGVKRDLRQARRYFIMAANHGHPKAYFQLAKMQQKGMGMKRNLAVAAELYKVVAERGPWGSLLRWALECYVKGEIGMSLLFYSRAAELGYEIAQSNAAWVIEKYLEEGVCLGHFGVCTEAERHQRAHMLLRYASEQGNEHAALLIGDAFYYGRGTERDLERAAEAYMHARSQQNAQAMFNLGYMHEHGLGLPMDLHLAKRYYDQAIETDPAAVFPVTLALASLWLRQHWGNSMLVQLIDNLPQLIPGTGNFITSISIDGGSATIATLFVCLLTVLYLRQRQRQLRDMDPIVPAQ